MSGRAEVKVEDLLKMDDEKPRLGEQGRVKEEPTEQDEQIKKEVARLSAVVQGMKTALSEVSPSVMASTPERSRGLEEQISKALKTLSRKALLLIYENRFPKEHPNKIAYDVLQVKRHVMFQLKPNKAQHEALQKNDVDKFDISALFLILRHVCGLSNKPSDWKDPRRLEGNIQNIKDLRNKEAHWTEEVYTKEDLEAIWTQLVEATLRSLRLSGLEKWVDIFVKNFRQIREGTFKHEDDLLQKELQSELQEQYKKGRKTTLMPLVWAGRGFEFHHSAIQTYVPTKFSIGRSSSEKLVDTNQLLEALEGSQVVVLQGESGTGKTSLLRYFASVWKVNKNLIPRLSSIEYLLLLDCNAVSRNASSINDIIKEVFPITTSSTKAIEVVKTLTRAGGDVMIMIDAFDERLEAPKAEAWQSREFKKLFKELQQKFPRALFLVTTRRHCTPEITSLCEDVPVVVTAYGFNWSSARDFIEKILAVEKRSEDPDALLKILSPYEELVKIPQLLCWSTLLWIKHGSGLFSTRGKIFDSITDFMLRKLCYINGMRILANSLPHNGLWWLQLVAELAYSQAKEGQCSLNNFKEEIETLESLALSLELRPREALSSLIQCDSYMTAHGECVNFQFIHKSHANFLAAYHICVLLEEKKSETLAKLINDLPMDKKAILTFVVSLLFKDKNKPVEYRRLKEIATLSKMYVTYYDINYFLEIIEESQYSKRLVQELGKHLPQRLNLPPQPQVGEVNSHYLWIRRKELERREALLMLLSCTKPSRLCVRLSDGVMADDQTRGSKMVQTDVGSAMRLLKEAYEDHPLCELRLSDFTASSRLDWPENVWWLSIDRCKIEGDIGLPCGLLKLSMSECTNFAHLTIPSSVKSIKLLWMDLHDPHLPQELEALVLHYCDITKLPLMPPKLKIRRFENCHFWESSDYPEFLMKRLSFLD